jgi:hypothetical protein
MDRFISKCAPPNENCCVIWLGCLNSGGYGVFAYSGKRVMAHRFSWEAANLDKVPDGLQVDHVCRVRNCVNPGHLEPVTPGENMRRSWVNRPRRWQASS